MLEKPPPLKEVAYSTVSPLLTNVAPTAVTYGDEAGNAIENYEQSYLGYGPESPLAINIVYP